MNDPLKSTIADFIAGQIANAESPLSVKLAMAMRTAIAEARESGAENCNAFSVDAIFEDGEFIVAVAFTEDRRKTILYEENTDAVVNSLWLGLPEADEELARLAGLMLSEGWVSGYSE